MVPRMPQSAEVDVVSAGVELACGAMAVRLRACNHGRLARRRILRGY
jgi:hypothetical protein